ncbi:MAG: Argininosuccinate synthase [Gammaproteobacteria bacterium]|nr:MAG: argininosuccinate synthase [Gammaproteobacteria bacterium TMED257]CAI8336255.1 MAG: Argininosuccinate synthase [Gammaproteobacteria bacterium]|tara:strand:+ start:3329 stop:4519 length:1191 start_codon:yes stop_codon:yes gene_type:complete
MKFKKVVLAYSGGLDTSVIAKWLMDKHKCEVITFTADIGQGSEVKDARTKAKKLGIKKIYIEDLKEVFVKDYVYPMFRSNAIYEGEYFLGTSIARPLISKRLIDIAKKEGADAICHGATGKGNDQVRFELSAYALNPKIKIIAPWREWEFNSRKDLVRYARLHKIAIDFDSGKKSPYSMDANILHTSYEGGILEDPWKAPEDSMWLRTKSIEKSSNKPAIIELEFKNGDIIKLNKKIMSPAKLLSKLNDLAGKHGIGRVDIVENRYVGIKSRGCYETPGGTIYHKAHRAIESITMDRELLHLKEDLCNKYTRLIYNGYWFSPERESLQLLIDNSQKRVSGVVKVKLFKGNIVTLGRKSPYSIYNEDLSTFEKDSGEYNQRDAEGFIKVNSLRLRNQ